MNIGSIAVGSGAPLVVIAGPCVIESEASTLAAARRLAELSQRLAVSVVFKSSFDKANRTSVHSFRGPGLEEGLRILARARAESGIPLLTDVHTPDQCARVGEVVDVLQIPAFLCRQTDLLAAAGRIGRAVNVKKGQFVAPHEMRHAVDKLAEVGCKDVLLTERGASFGYRDLIVDFRTLVWMRTFAPVCFDATHAVQSGSGPDGQTTGGDRELARPLARAAAAVGIDSLFCEVHEDPDRAKSDAQSQLTWPLFEETVRDVLAVKKAAGL